MAGNPTHNHSPKENFPTSSKHTKLDLYLAYRKAQYTVRYETHFRILSAQVCDIPFQTPQDM